MGTTISTNDIRDKAVNSSKLADNISITGNLEVTKGSIRTPATFNYLSILDSGSATQGIATDSLLVSTAYANDWGKIPVASGSAYFGGDVIVNGNLTIKGSSFIVDSETISMADNIIQLNSNFDATATPTENAGIEINRGSAPNSQIIWDEGNDYWTLTNDGTSFYRIVDLNLADSRYVNSAGDTMTGALKINNSSGGKLLEIYSTNSDSSIRLGYNASEYSFDLKYTGSEAGALNSLELWADGTGALGAATKVFRVQQDGIFRVIQGLDVSGNITLSGTIDGVELAEHAANTVTNLKHVTDAYLGAMAGTHGTPSSTNKYVTNSDTRLTNSRIPTKHGDTLHDALGYFDSISDGTNVRSATTAKQNIKITGINGSKVTVSNDASYDAIVTIDSTHNHDTTYVKLQNPDEQTIISNVKIDGNLYVTGTTTYVNTEEMSVTNSSIILNSDLPNTADPTEDSGIEIQRGTQNNAILQWNESNDYWEIAVKEKNIAEGTSTIVSRSRIVDLTFADGRYLKLADGGTIANNITIGATNRAADSYVRVLAGDSNKAGFEAYGNGNGTGYIYVGDSLNYGGGISYNGDLSPAFASGETADRVTFFRRTNGTSTAVISYPHNSSTVYFNGNIVLSTANATVDGVDVSVLSSNYSSHAADIVGHITAAERTAWNAKQSALGYTPVNKAGDTMTGDLKINGDVIAGTRLAIGYDSVDTERFRFQYNGSSGRLELWANSSESGSWIKKAEFARRGIDNDYSLLLGGNEVWHAGNFDPSSVDNYGGWAFKVNGTQYETIGPGGALNFKAGSNITLSRSAANEITITGGQGYAGWKLQANGGTTSTIASNGTVNFAGGGGTSVSRSGNTITITSTNTSIKNHLITFSGDIVSQTLTHSFGIDPSLYIVCLGSNGPQRHVYYKNKTTNTVDICIDDKVYNNETLEVSVSIQKV